VDAQRASATPRLARLPPAIAWSPDGRYVVTGMQENALHGWRVVDGGDIEMGGYPGQPLSLSFSHDGRFLVTSGGTPVSLGFDPPGSADQPVECAMASKTPVSCVSCHPQQALIAAGYHNGAVLLCQPHQEAVLFIKGSRAGPSMPWPGRAMAAASPSAPNKACAAGCHCRTRCSGPGSRRRARPRNLDMSDHETRSKDEFFKQLATISDAMSAAHGKDFAMGALVLAARFIAEREARPSPGRPGPDRRQAAGATRAHAADLAPSGPAPASPFTPRP
jgi:hypothetical protein